MICAKQNVTIGKQLPKGPKPRKEKTPSRGRSSKISNTWTLAPTAIISYESCIVRSLLIQLNKTVISR